GRQSPQGTSTYIRVPKTSPFGGNRAARRRDLSAAHARLTSDIRGASPYQLAPAGRRPESPDPGSFRVHGAMRIRLDGAISEADAGTFSDSTCQVESAAPKAEALARRRCSTEVLGSVVTEKAFP